MSAAQNPELDNAARLDKAAREALAGAAKAFANELTASLKRAAERKAAKGSRHRP